MCAATFLVLEVGLLVFVDGHASAFSLGLVVVFATGTFHYVSQSLMIQSTSSLEMQYCISNHFIFGSIADWIQYGA